MLCIIPKYRARFYSLILSCGNLRSLPHEAASPLQLGLFELVAGGQ